MMSEHRKLDMAFPFVLWVVLHVTFVYYALNIVHSWYRLRTVPGPFFASISYLWILWKASSGQSADLYPELGKKYGSLVRIGPNTILTDDPEVLRKMNGARSAYGKDMSYHGSIKQPGFVNMFTTTNIAEHDEIRAKLAGPYGGRETDSMEPLYVCTKTPNDFSISSEGEFENYMERNCHVKHGALEEARDFEAARLDKHHGQSLTLRILSPSPYIWRQRKGDI